MKKLTTLIVKDIVKSTLLIGLFIVVMQLLVLFLSQLKYVDSNNYTYLDLLYFVASQTIVVIYQISPMVGFIGTLVGLGKLSKNNELTVMQVSGYSVLRLMSAVFIACVLMSSIIISVTEGWGFTLANRGQVKMLGWRGQRVLVNSDVWVKHGNQFYYIKNVLPDHNLHDVYSFAIGANNSVAHVNYSGLVSAEHGKWAAKDLLTHSLINGKVVIQHENHVDLPLVFDFKHYYAKNNTISGYNNLLQVHKLIAFYQSIGSNADNYKYIYWKQILMPVIILVMMLLAIPFVIRHMRAVTLSSQIFKGVLIGFSLYVLEVIVGRLGLYFGLNPLYSALIPPAIFVILLIFMMRKLV